MKASHARVVSGITVQAVVLFALWLVLSGHYDAFHVGLGAAGVALVVLLNRRLRRERAGESSLTHIRALYAPRYVLWLLKEIVLANLHIAYVILHPRLPIGPRVLAFRTNLPSEAAKVVLGNSITLTPGTFAIDIEGDQFLVHALTWRSAAGLEAGEMQGRVMRLFGGESPRTDASQVSEADRRGSE